MHIEPIPYIPSPNLPLPPPPTSMHIMPLSLPPLSINLFCFFPGHLWSYQVTAPPPPPSNLPKWIKISQDTQEIDECHNSILKIPLSPLKEEESVICRISGRNKLTDKALSSTQLFFSGLPKAKEEPNATPSFPPLKNGARLSGHALYLKRKHGIIIMGGDNGFGDEMNTVEYLDLNEKTLEWKVSVFFFLG